MRKIVFIMLAGGLLLLNACKNDPVVEPKGVAYKLTDQAKITWTGRAADGKFNQGTVDLKGVTRVDGFDFDVLGDEFKGGVFTVPVSSINVTNLPAHLKPLLEAHLKTADFFYMAMHPNVTFKLTSGTPLTAQTGVDANYQIRGEMTLLGSTHPIAFKAKVNIVDQTMTLKGSFVINQTMWGMNYHIDPSYPDADRILPAVEVEFDLVATSK